VNDIQKAREFDGKTLGLEVSNGPEGTLVVPLSGGTKALMFYGVHTITIETHEAKHTATVTLAKREFLNFNSR
jgi:hypothetical protein